MVHCSTVKRDGDLNFLFGGIDIPFFTIVNTDKDAILVIGVGCASDSGCFAVLRLISRDSECALDTVSV